MTPDDDGAPDALLRAWCQDVGWLIVEVASAPPPEPEGDSLLDLLEAAVLSTDAPADRSVDAIAAIADGAVQADTPRRLTDAGLSPATIAWWLVWSYQRLPGAPSEPRRRALAGLRAWAEQRMAAEEARVAPTLARLSRLTDLTPSEADSLREAVGSRRA